MATIASVTQYYGQNSSVTTTAKCTPGVALPAGQSIVVVVAAVTGASITITGVSDDAGNTYTVNGSAFFSGSNTLCAVYHCLNPTTGLTSAQGVTATFSSTGARGSVTVLAHSVQLSAADGSATASGLAASLNPAVRAITTATASDWVVSAMNSPNQNTATLNTTSSATNPTQGMNFTAGVINLMSTTSQVNVAWAYPTATGTYGAGWTMATSSASGGVTAAYTLPAGAVAWERFYPGTIGALSPGTNATGPQLRYDGYTFGVAGQLLGVIGYTTANGPTAGQTVTAGIKDAAGSTTLVSGTVSASGSVGEFTVTFGTPLAVSTGTTYHPYIDDTGTAAFRYTDTTGGATAATVQDISRVANGGFPTAADLYYVDVMFWPVAAATATNPRAPVVANRVPLIRSNTF